MDQFSENLVIITNTKFAGTVMKNIIGIIALKTELFAILYNIINDCQLMFLI
jgi:hypothetical protein